ncbi:MAG: MFS transporter [Neisseriaceae bacterium]|nr:MFS transporter [Neisseriaceae bacterium]
MGQPRVKPVYSKEEKRKSIMAIVGASSGNLVEWYDFYIYAFTSIYFAHLFFPEGDATSQLLRTAGIFAVGFLMRPVGGWFFGRIADRYGRKKSLVSSIVLMCVGSFLIACLPTYEQVGVLAPLLLLLGRLIQGLSVGGEYGATATYMSEVALPGRRGFFSSFQYVTLIGGQLLATVTILILVSVFSKEAMYSWAWRIPFFIGSIAALGSLYLRRHLKETAPTADKTDAAAGSLTHLFRFHTRAFVTVFGFTAGGSLLFYTFTTYMQKYLINTSGFSPTSSTQIMTVALLVFMLAQPLFGILSDNIGRRQSMMWFAVLGMLCTYPALYLLQHTRNPYAVFFILIVMLGIASFYTSIGGIVKSEMFPVEVRALGVGLSFALANAIFGGSAEFVALSFKASGIESGFFIYVTVMLGFALIAALSMPRKATYLKD